MRYEIESTTRVGNRPSNEDRYAVFEKPGAVLLALADGLGGHSGGSLASETLVASIGAAFAQERAPVAEPRSFLAQAVTQAHHTVYARGQRQNPPVLARTTCVLCLIQEGRAWWAHVGDSRLYLVRYGAATRQTRDHSYTERLLRQGQITAKEALTHAGRNQLTRCVGAEANPPKVSVSVETPLLRGDLLLLCSDGLWGGLDDGLIGQLLLGRPLDEAVNLLAARAEEMTYPRSDNISLVALRWLSATAPYAIKAPPVQAATEIEAPPPVIAEPRDELEKAIADVETALRQYKREIS